MYHYIPIAHEKIITQYVNDWNAQSEKAFVIITFIQKVKRVDSTILDHLKRLIPLSIQMETIGVCITGQLPKETQVIANMLDGYEFFEEAHEFLKFKSQITNE